MKVLQIIDSLNAGGAEMLAVNIANELKQIYIESHLCVTRTEGPLKKGIKEDVSYFYLNKKRTLDVKALYKLSRYIKHHQIELIHAHSTSYFLASCVKMLNPKVKLVWHDHYGNSEFLTKKSRRIVQRISFLFDAVIVVNTKLLNWNKKFLSAKQYFRLNNFAKFSNVQKETKLHGKEGKRIVHVAGFTEQKDHITLVKAFAQLLAAYPDWTLHLIGKRYGGTYDAWVDSCIKQNGLGDSVFSYGLKTDIKNILDQADIGVLSSKSEGLPVSVLEYGLVGLPVVLTDVGECKQLINDKEFVVPPEKPELLSRALITMIENPYKRKKASQELHHLVQQEYTINSFLTKLNEIYQSI